jgi:hypothetical protein
MREEAASHSKWALTSLAAAAPAASAAHVTSSPVVVSRELATTAASLWDRAGPGASAAYAFLLDDGSVVRLPTPAGAAPGFDARLVSLCDPALLQVQLAVACTGSATASNDALETVVSPQYPSLARLFAARARVLRVVFAVCGPGVAADAVLACLQGKVSSHPGMPLAAAPVSLVRSALAEAREAVAAQSAGWVRSRRPDGTPGPPPTYSAWDVGMTAPALGVAVDAVVFVRAGDSQDRWACTSPDAGDAPFGCHLPPPVASRQWLPGIVLSMSAQDGSVTVALAHVGATVVAPPQCVVRVVPVGADPSVSRDDDVYVLTDAPWLPRAVECLRIALGPSSAPGAAADVVAAMARLPVPAVPPAAALPGNAAQPSPRVDTLWAVVEQAGGSGSAPAHTLVCHALGKASVSVPAVRFNAPLTPQVGI